MRRSLVALAALAALAALPAPGRAAAGCDDVVEVDRFAYLRQLTLDLWGRVPTVDELEAIAGLEDVPAATVDAMLADDRLLEGFVGRYHRDLLWPNIDQLDLVNPAVALLLPAMFYEYAGDGDPDRLFLLYTGLYGRGGLVPCKDEPATFDEAGYPELEPWPDGTQRDGWVMVEPYWAPGTQVKVCALEAQALEKASNGKACTTFEGMVTGTCGCGPGLERCASIESGTVIREALQEQSLRMVAAPLREGRPYFDFLTDAREVVNGPIVHYYRHLAPLAVDPLVLTSPVPPYALPDVPFTDTTWRSAERLAPHSGVLTSLLYLLRFQTARARANRFWSAFMCSPFEAPAGLDLPSPSDPCSDEPDLRERCGCNGCHAVLEPASAYWARFSEAGSMYMDPLFFPEALQRCATCAATGTCDFVCDRFYLTAAGHPDEAPYVGTLKALMWRPEAELASVAAGPRALVEEQLASGVLARCAAQKTFERLHGRAPTDAERAGVVREVADAFAASGYDFRALLRAWVTGPTYRRLAR